MQTDTSALKEAHRSDGFRNIHHVKSRYLGWTAAQRSYKQVAGIKSWSLFKQEADHEDSFIDKLHKTKFLKKSADDRLPEGLTVCNIPWGKICGAEIFIVHHCGLGFYPFILGL